MDEDTGRDIKYYREQLSLGIGALKEDPMVMDIRDMLPILNNCMRTAQTIRMLEDNEFRFRENRGRNVQMA